MNEPKDSSFVTRKGNIVNNLSNTNYDVGNEITYKTEVLKSNLYDYNDNYNLVRGDIIVNAASETQLLFKNCAAFTKSFTKIDGTIDHAEDLDLVMLMYNIIQYSSNY